MSRLVNRTPIEVEAVASPTVDMAGGLWMIGREDHWPQFAWWFDDPVRGYNMGVTPEGPPVPVEVPPDGPPGFEQVLATPRETLPGGWYCETVLEDEGTPVAVGEAFRAMEAEWRVDRNRPHVEIYTKGQPTVLLCPVKVLASE